MATKSPFLSSFIASILILLVLCGLTAIFIFLWRYFGRRPKPKSPNNTIPLTTLEDGLTRSTVPRFSFRGPSRLGGNSPSSAKRADGASEAQLQFFAQSRTNDDTQGDGQHLVSGVSQSSAHIVGPMTAERGDWVEGNTKRAKDTSNLTSSDNDKGMASEGDQPRSFVSSYPPRVPPLPPIPPPPTRARASRFSMSTVWSQESMWPREKKPDVPVPPPAHMAVSRRVGFTPTGFNPHHRQSTVSVPRSVGQSDFDEDF